MASRDPDEIDREVGKKLREIRKSVGITQMGLADQLGLSFQQIQKYERGTNRISAGRLFKLATLFDVEVAYFFGGCAPEEFGFGRLPDELRLGDEDALIVYHGFKRLKSRQLRKSIMDLIAELAD